MAKRKSPEPLKKVTLNLYERDVERMEALYPKAGYTVAVRELVRTHVMRVDSARAAVLDESLVDDIDLDIGEDIEGV